MKLKELAHSRTGDKGNTAITSVIAYRPEDYARIVQHVTVEAVKNRFTGIVKGEISRYEYPEIGALNFVMMDALGGGVTRSLALDAHGKSFSSAMLDMEIPE